MSKRSVRLIGTVVAILSAAAIVGVGALAIVDGGAPTPSAAAERSNSMGSRRIPVAVLGDSDSHSYQDRVLIPEASNKRGGEFRRSTYQWTEVIGRLRGEQVDLGPWGRWGTKITWARLREATGFPGRAPPKEDYLFNFALSGAECSDLMKGHWRQAPRLLAQMNSEPDRWKLGIVVVRIGINSFGSRDSLDKLAHDANSAEVGSAVRSCTVAIREAVELIHGRFPGMRFVLVGVLNNADWPRYLDRWQTPGQISNINAGLDRFDNALRSWVQADSRLAFFDDRAWFARQWGSRGNDGLPSYRALMFNQTFAVEHGEGDHPRCSVLLDGHAGAVWNAKWAQSLVELVNARFDTGIEPIADSEIAALLDPTRSLGMHKEN